jgi:predicted RNA-binding Zn ribbon-like protein
VGLLVVLDARRLSRTEGAADMLRYSPAAVMDAYEVLREIIDDAEHLPGLFVAVLADAALATGDPRRALAQYAALQMRVWPDVRPGDRQNPMAPLVWLAA